MGSIQRQSPLLFKGSHLVSAARKLLEYVYFKFGTFPVAVLPGKGMFVSE